MTAYGGTGGIFPVVLNFGANKSKWSASRPGRFTSMGTVPLPVEWVDGWASEPALEERNISCTFRQSNHDS
jgi:hypothetical protein